MAGSNGHVIRHGRLFLRKSDFWSSEAARIHRYGRLRRWTGRVARGLGGSPEPDVVGAGGLGGEPVDGLNRQVGHGRIYYHHSTRTAPRQSHVRPRRRGSTRRSSRGTPPPSSGMERPGAEVRRRAYPAAAPRLPSRFRLTVGPSSWLSLPPTARSGSWWPWHRKRRGKDALLLLTTIRRYDLYSMTIHGNDHRYCGVTGRRTVVFVNADDLANIRSTARRDRGWWPYRDHGGQSPRRFLSRPAANREVMDRRARQSFRVSSGTISKRSPTSPRSATWKMGASSSLFMAMIVFESFIPARCCIAPEMPTAT